MTVYVDDPVWPWRGSKWCHMTADTHDELHAFAKKLGLKRAWFQDKPHHQHYDLTAAKRAQAIRMGAEAVDWRAYPGIYRQLEIGRPWTDMEREMLADRALGLSHDEIMDRAHERMLAYVEWQADRALEVKAPRRRRRA